MAKRLSEQLADLSVRAKNAEDAAAAAQKEAHDKFVARREQARATATTAVEKVNKEIKSAGDSAIRDWNTVKAKIAADMIALKANVATAKHDRDVKRAENLADRLEWEAGFAIDYAIASVEQAKLAVLDAIDGRVAVEEAKRAYPAIRHGGMAWSNRSTGMPTRNRDFAFGMDDMTQNFVHYSPGVEGDDSNIEQALQLKSNHGGWTG